MVKHIIIKHWPPVDFHVDGGLFLFQAVSTAVNAAEHGNFKTIVRIIQDAGLHGLRF